MQCADCGTNLASASGSCAVTQTMMHQCRMSWTDDSWLVEARQLNLQGTAGSGFA